MSETRFPSRLLRSQITLILTAWGLDADVTEAVADVMIDTDLSGIASHGISMLATYDSMRREGKLNLRARPKTIRDAGATILIDADAGLGHKVSIDAMQSATAKARAFGVGIASVRNSHHFGAAGYYARIAAQQGLIGFVTSSTRFVSVVPSGSATPLLGTNPIAFAAPAGDNDGPGGRHCNQCRCAQQGESVCIARAAAS